MTNEELKKKISQIIADYFCPQRNEHKNLWEDDRLCYSKMNFAECEQVTECTDALIAAGIGDVRERKFEADHYWSMWQGSLVELERAEHRAEVAERALKNALNNALNNDTCYFCNEKIPCRCEHRDWGSDECIKSLLQQAEKELEEEKGGER